MNLIRTLCQLVRKWFGDKPADHRFRRRRRPCAYRPALEVLEDRLAPAAIATLASLGVPQVFALPPTVSPIPPAGMMGLVDVIAIRTPSTNEFVLVPTVRLTPLPVQPLPAASSTPLFSPLHLVSVTPLPDEIAPGLPGQPLLRVTNRYAYDYGVDVCLSGECTPIPGTVTTNAIARAIDSYYAHFGLLNGAGITSGMSDQAILAAILGWADGQANGSAKPPDLSPGGKAVWIAVGEPNSDNLFNRPPANEARMPLESYQNLGETAEARATQELHGGTWLHWFELGYQNPKDPGHVT